MVLWASSSPGLSAGNFTAFEMFLRETKIEKSEEEI